MDAGRERIGRLPSKLAAAAWASLLAVALGGCEKVPLMSPAGAHIFLQANPPLVAANGGRSVVTAVLTEPAGTYVPDGTDVFFFSDLGSIDPRGKTVDGLARVYFVADSRSGQASVTAYSGGAAPAAPSPAAGAGSASASGQGSVTIVISVGSALPSRLLLAASPNRITSPRHTSLIANVFDASGNPVQNVPVIFAISAAQPLEETLGSGSAPQITDSNGQAFDTLYTRALATAPQKSITVSATVPTLKDPATVKVYVN